MTVTQAFTAAVATSGGDYTGPSDTTYIIEVTSGSCDDFVTPPQVTVTTTTGIDMGGPYTVTAPNTPISIGAYGVTVSFGPGALTGLRKGDKFYIPVTAQSSGAIKTLVLANNLPAGLLSEDGSSSPGEELCGPDLSIWLYIKKNIELEKNRTSSPPLTNWEASSTGITLKAGAEAYDSSWTDNGTLLPLDLKGGDVYVQIRYLKTANCNTLSSLDSASSVESTLGPVVADNPLALGVYKALLNSNGTEVHYVAV